MIWVQLQTSEAPGSVLAFSAVMEGEVAEKGAGLTPAVPVRNKV
jgi:hypothetical protein